MKILISFCICFFCFDASAQVSVGITGDPADVRTTTKPGTILVGGGQDVDEVMQWMIERSGGGDFVIIRASGSTGYNDYIKSLGVVNSVETLLIDSKEKANLQETRDKIRNAEALFIAGGDQANYMKYWTDTEVSRAIEYLITTKKVPIGGTSAGCAVLSGFVFDAKKGTALSEVVLKNPFDTTVSIASSFIHIPYLKNVIADQHYSQRKRHGRHVVFMARILNQEKPTSLMGIGIDESTAVAFNEDGSFKVLGKGNAFFLLPAFAPKVANVTPLTWAGNSAAINVYRCNANSQPGQIDKLHPNAKWHVVDGILWESDDEKP